MPTFKVDEEMNRSNNRHLEARSEECHVSSRSGMIDDRSRNEDHTFWRNWNENERHVEWSHSQDPSLINPLYHSITRGRLNDDQSYARSGGARISEEGCVHVYQVMTVYNPYESAQGRSRTLLSRHNNNINHEISGKYYEKRFDSSYPLLGSGDLLTSQYEAKVYFQRSESRRYELRPSSSKIRDNSGIHIGVGERKGCDNSGDLVDNRGDREKRVTGCGQNKDKLVDNYKNARGGYHDQRCDRADVKQRGQSSERREVRGSGPRDRQEILNNNHYVRKDDDYRERQMKREDYKLREYDHTGYGSQERQSSATYNKTNSSKICDNYGIHIGVRERKGYDNSGDRVDNRGDREKRVTGSVQNKDKLVDNDKKAAGGYHDQRGDRADVRQRGQSSERREVRGSGPRDRQEISNNDHYVRKDGDDRERQMKREDYKLKENDHTGYGSQERQSSATYNKTNAREKKDDITHLDKEWEIDQSTSYRSRYNNQCEETTSRSSRPNTQIFTSSSNAPISASRSSDAKMARSKSSNVPISTFSSNASVSTSGSSDAKETTSRNSNAQVPICRTSIMQVPISGRSNERERHPVTAHPLIDLGSQHGDNHLRRQRNKESQISRENESLVRAGKSREGSQIHSNEKPRSKMVAPFLPLHCPSRKEDVVIKAVDPRNQLSDGTTRQGVDKPHEVKNRDKMREQKMSDVNDRSQVETVGSILDRKLQCQAMNCESDEAGKFSTRITIEKLTTSVVDNSIVKSAGTPTFARRAIDTFDERIETVDLSKRTQLHNEQRDNVDVPMEENRSDSPSVYPEKSHAMGITVIRGKRRSSNIAVEQEVNVSPEFQTQVAPLAKVSRNTLPEMSRTTCISNAEGPLHAVSMPIDSSKIILFI